MSRKMLILLTAASTVASVAPAIAQTTVEGRVTRLEKEIRAVQRKVFPGGAGQTLEPDITAPTPVVPAAGSPATSAVGDLNARVNAIETQLRSLTAQVEQGSYKIRQLEAAVEALRAPAAVVAPVAVAPAPVPSATTPSTSVPARAAQSASQTASASVPASARPAAAAPRPTSAASTPGEARIAAVASVERPATGDPANDSYTYGFRLWEAKFYPEAQVQLKETIDKYGTTAIASRAHNLLGRAYLDGGKPALASVAFYENYQKRPKGDRAADSLAWLGEALIQLKKPADACKVYGELEDVYGAALKSDLRAMMEKGRARAKCGG